MQGDRFFEFLIWGHGAGFVLYFLVLWGLISYGISWMSGWHRLAQRFRWEQDFDGERWRFQSGSMRLGAHYNGVLTLGANREGIYLAVLFPFRLAHPPLFIPWSEITVSDRRYVLIAGTQFVLGREAQIPLWVYKKTGDRLVAYRPTDGGAMQGVYSRPGLDEPRPIV
jgi:hypothetical protein